MTNKIPLGSDFVIFNDAKFSHQDIYTVVDKFYKKIVADELLSIPFSSVTDWPHHIDRLTQFWWIKLGGTPYMFSQYSPIPKHFFSGFNQILLTRWLGIFSETLNEVLAPAQITEWESMANRIGKHLIKMNGLFANHQSSK